MRQITRVLCGIDFSEESQHALAHAVVLAKWYNASLTGVFVYCPSPSPVPDASGFAFPGVLLEDAYRKALETQLESFIESVNSGVVPASVRIATGNPTDGILETASSTGSDLIVVGTHGFGGFQHLILGSVAERLLRRAACPVLTVPPRARKTSHLPFKRILCPVDFGDTSKAALELATSIASEGDADLTILHVLEPSDADPLTYRPITVPEYHQARYEEACAQLKALVDTNMREWCRPSTHIVRGKPYREILGAASEDATDLIVMGVHGRNPVDLAVFGSTTNHVVRSATCPVMTLRN